MGMIPPTILRRRTVEKEPLPKYESYTAMQGKRTMAAMHYIQREIDRRSQEPTTQYVTNSGMVVSYE